MVPSTAAAPLNGIRVLELARILAGPWCGQLLADLGADVVKVERAGSGDDTRQWGPPFVAARDGGEAGDLGAAYFHSCNRGKRCIAADFETAEGRALVRRLAAHADVVIENFKIGGLERYGLDPESLRALNPRLVVCSISGFGHQAVVRAAHCSNSFSSGSMWRSAERSAAKPFCAIQENMRVNSFGRRFSKGFGMRNDTTGPRPACFNIWMARGRVTASPPSSTALPMYSEGSEKALATNQPISSAAIS